MARYIIGDTHNVEILREFSLTELIGRVYPNSPGTVLPQRPLNVEELKKVPFIHFFGKPWDVVYTRTESDERGSYTAVAFRMRK